MPKVNFFDMTDEEKREYYSDAKNFVAVDATLLAKPQKLQMGYATVKRRSQIGLNKQVHDDMDYEAKTKSFDERYKQRGQRIIPSPLDKNPRMSRSRQKIYRQRLMNHVSKTDKLREFIPTDYNPSTNPAAQAMDLNIQKLLSEAETMIQRYKLSKSVGDSLKADIMKNHLPDYAMKKASIEQQKKDEEIAKIMNPDGDANGNDEDGERDGRPQEGGAAASGIGVGGELEKATKKLKSSGELFLQIRSSYATENKTQKNAIVEAMRVLKDFSRNQIFSFIQKATPAAPYKKSAQKFLKALFMAGNKIDEKENDAIWELIKEMKPEIEKEFFEGLNIPFPDKNLNFDTYQNR